MYRIIFLLITIWTEIEAYGLMIDSVIAVLPRGKIYLYATFEHTRFCIFYSRFLIIASYRSKCSASKLLTKDLIEHEVFSS